MACLSSLALCLSACGDKSKDDDTANDTSLASEVSLNKLPEAKDMLKTAGSSLALAPSGNAPKLSELAENYDDYFVGGVVAEILAKKDASSAVSVELEGDMERGSAICENIANVAQALGELKSGSLCYMKQIPALSAPTVSLEKASASVNADNLATQLFAQEAADKLVQVNISMGDEQQQLFIKVLGSNSVSNQYKFEMLECEGDEVTGTEVATVDYADKKFTAINTYKFQDEDENGNSEGADETKITAYLSEDSEGNLSWDLSKDRVLERKWSQTGSYTWNEQATEYTYQTVSKNVISSEGSITSYVNSKSSNSFGNETNASEDKLWSKAIYTGDNIIDLRVAELAVRAKSSYTYTGGNDTRDIWGAVEWKDTLYSDTSSSSIYKEAESASLSEDAVFKSSVSEVSPSFSGSCSATADVIVAVDMTTEGARAVEQSCGGGEEQWDALDELYDACYGSDVESARQYIWDQN